LGRSKVISLDAAVAMVPSGATLGVGGVLLKRKPIGMLKALASSGVNRLRLCSFLASLDAELLAVYGALAECHSGYVGFEQLGFAPRYGAAVAAGEIEPYEYTEFLFTAGLRAALAGLPFMPAKGGAGSDVLSELGFAEIEDPYGGETVVAVPALRPDVAVIHADAADAAGNVLGPAQPDFLWDFDANIARASHVVIVSVERVVDRVSAGGGRPVLLYGYEVDAVVEVPGGARPTAMPGTYGADLEAIRAYLTAATEPGAARKALEALV
jgi:glutaconate CoA-transferase subunit A